MTAPTKFLDTGRLPLPDSGAEELHAMTQDLIDKYPNLSERTAARAAILTAGLMVFFAEEEAGAHFQAHFIEAAAAGEPWAVEFVNAVAATELPKYRPTYERARLIGADPVMALRTAHDGVGEDLAAELVAALTQEDEKRMAGGKIPA